MSSLYFGRALFERNLPLPERDKSGPIQRWYAFDAGRARFYILHAAWADGNVGTANSYKNNYDYHWAPGTPQYQWLQSDLASHPSVLKFAFLHYPLYSDNPNEPTDTYLLGSNGLEGLLKQHGVDLAFTGHAHIYERNLPSASGITNYITGVCHTWNAWHLHPWMPMLTSSRAAACLWQCAVPTSGTGISLPESLVTGTNAP
jgi:hypothetical protein